MIGSSPRIDSTFVDEFSVGVITSSKIATYEKVLLSFTLYHSTRLLDVILRTKMCR